nr:MAG TPA: hypothetical protein [Caudoviricetes sp.]
MVDFPNLGGQKIINLLHSPLATLISASVIL